MKTKGKTYEAPQEEFEFARAMARVVNVEFRSSSFRVATDLERVQLSRTGHKRKRERLGRVWIS